MFSNKQIIAIDTDAIRSAEQIIKHYFVLPVAQQRAMTIVKAIIANSISMNGAGDGKIRKLFEQNNLAFTATNSNYVRTAVMQYNQFLNENAWGTANRN